MDNVHFKPLMQEPPPDAPKGLPFPQALAASNSPFKDNRETYLVSLNLQVKGSVPGLSQSSQTMHVWSAVRLALLRSKIMHRQMLVQEAYDATVILWQASGIDKVRAQLRIGQYISNWVNDPERQWLLKHPDPTL